MQDQDRCVRLLHGDASGARPPLRLRSQDLGDRLPVQPALAVQSAGAAGMDVRPQLLHQSSGDVWLRAVAAVGREGIRAEETQARPVGRELEQLEPECA